MTVSSTTSRTDPANGNGAATSFPFSFKIFVKSDLVVIRTDSDGVESTLTLDSHYSVTLNADQNNNPGGTVTYPISGSPLPTGEKLTIYRAVPQTQSTDITNGGGFYPNTVEDMADRATMVAQDAHEKADRAIVIPVSDTSRDMTLPGKDALAGKYLAFDAAGLPTASAGTGSDSTLRTDLAADNGSALWAHKDSVSGSVKIDGAAYLNLKVKGLKKTFGAVGDGSTNDYAKINTAFTSTGKIIEIEAGTFLYNSALSAPTCSQIIGQGEDVSILKPGASVTKGLSVGGGSYPRVFRDFQVDGVLTSNATGVFFGDAGSCAVQVDNLIVKRFTGASGVNVRIGDVLKSKFTRLTSQAGGMGMLVERVTSGFPTTTTFAACVFTDNTAQGTKHVDGEEVIFTDGTDFESNGQEGSLLLPRSGEALYVNYDDVWFEDNWNGNGCVIVNGGSGYAAGNVLTVSGGTSTAAMQITVGTVGGGGVITSATITTTGSYSSFPAMPFSVTGGAGTGATFKLGFHVRAGDGTSMGSAKNFPSFGKMQLRMNTGTARGILLDGNAVNAVIREPILTATLFPSIVIANDAACTFPDFSNRYDYAITVSDANNKASWTVGPWRDYTPTLATNVGNASTSFASSNVVFCRFMRQGKTARIAFNISVTLNAITPTNVNLTLPSNITINKTVATAGNCDLGGTYQSMRVLADQSTNKIYLQRADITSWASGAACNLFGYIEFETT